jgi:hypothetical protein
MRTMSDASASANAGSNKKPFRRCGLIVAVQRKKRTVRRGTLVGLPVFGAFLIAMLLVAERAGLPTSLFAQLALIVLAIVIVGIAFGTRTLDGRQFFRPINGGTRSTRVLACAMMMGAGLPFLASASLWQESPLYMIGLWMSLFLSGAIYLCLVLPAFAEADASDIVRMVLVDDLHSAYRLAGYTIVLIGLVSALLALSSLIFTFARQQNLLPADFVVNGCIGLAALAALLGGRAGVVRLAALGAPIVLLASVFIAIVAAGLGWGDLQTLSRNILSAEIFTDSDAGNMSLTANSLSFIALFAMSICLLGIVFGNSGGSESSGSDNFGLRGMDVIFGAAAAILIVALGGFAIVASAAGTGDLFALHTLPLSLELPVSFAIAGAGAVMMILCVAIASCLFAVASVVLRGVGPVFTVRRQPDSRQLFRARLLIIVLSGLMIYLASEVDPLGAGAIALGALVLTTVITLPKLMVMPLQMQMTAGNARKINTEIGLQWLVSLIVLAGFTLQQPEKFILEDFSLGTLLAHPTLIALPAALAAGFVTLILLQLVSRFRAAA